MTYKNAFAELGFGGGKVGRVAAPRHGPGAAFPVLGEVIESLGGRYVTACDYGTTAAELALVTSRTSHVLAEDEAGRLDLATARGVVAAMRAIWQRAAGTDALAGVRVVVQGVGDVGLELVRLLVDEGAEVAFSEIDEERAELCCVEVDASRIDAARIFERPMDVFAPCATGEVITDEVARDDPGERHRRGRQQSARDASRRAPAARAWHLVRPGFRRQCGRGDRRLRDRCGTRCGSARDRRAHRGSACSGCSIRPRRAGSRRKTRRMRSPPSVWMPRAARGRHTPSWALAKLLDTII